MTEPLDAIWYVKVQQALKVECFEGTLRCEEAVRSCSSSHLPEDTAEVPRSESMHKEDRLQSKRAVVFGPLRAADYGKFFRTGPIRRCDLQATFDAFSNLLVLAVIMCCVAISRAGRD